MNWFLASIQVISGILLVAVILLQPRSAGLGSAFGGGATVARTRRGSEKVLFQATILLSVLFVAVSVAVILVP